MKRRLCVGCGRLLGLRAPIECHCWTSVRDGATIPYRIRTLRKSVLSVLDALSRAQSEADKANAAFRAQALNADLRAS